MTWYTWLIVVIPFFGVMYMAFYVKRYIRSVPDFISGGRICGRYLLAVGGMEAGLSESEERLFLRMDQVLAKEEENREAMKDMERRLKKTEDRLAKAEERLEKALKTESEKKTHASERWSALLRQATWLVGIACSAWIVITLINKLLP